MRDAVPRRMPLAWAEFTSFRQRLLKIGARVVEMLPDMGDEGAPAETSAGMGMRSGNPLKRSDVRGRSRQPESGYPFRDCPGRSSSNRSLPGGSYSRFWRRQSPGLWNEPAQMPRRPLTELRFRLAPTGAAPLHR